MLSLKKHIALFFIAILFFPSVAQAVHMYECHEHKVHKLADDNEVYEQQDTDCCKLHIPFETLSSGVFLENYSIINKAAYKLKFYTQSQIFKIVYLFKKSSRAPPIK